MVFPGSWFWVECSDSDKDATNDWLEVTVIIFAGCAFWFDPELEISSSEASAMVERCHVKWEKIGENEG